MVVSSVVPVVVSISVPVGAFPASVSVRALKLSVSVGAFPMSVSMGALSVSVSVGAFSASVSVGAVPVSVFVGPFRVFVAPVSVVAPVASPVGIPVSVTVRAFSVSVSVGALPVSVSVGAFPVFVAPVSVVVLVASPVVTPVSGLVGVVPVSIPIGLNVKVSPSVVTICGVVIPVGTERVFVPQMNNPEVKVTACPSGKVVVDSVTERDLVGKNVTVWPLVVRVDADDKLLGTVTVKLDQINDPELIVNVCSASPAVVSGKSISVPVDVGTGVEVKPSVVSLLVALTLGRMTVSLPISTKPELDTTVTPLGTDVVCGTSVGCWPVTAAEVSVKVSPRVVSMVEVTMEGKVTECVPITTTI